MTNLYTQKEVTELARANGFSDAASKVAGAIAMAETLTILSGVAWCDFDKVGDQNLVDEVDPRTGQQLWWYSFSAWQVRSLRADKGTGRIRDELRLPEPEFAARSAFAIYKGRGYRWTDWSTYNNGAYLSFLLTSPEAQVPPGSYRVAPGDTLTKIAARLGYTVLQLVVVNRIDLIRLGQVLLLPEFPHVATGRETFTSIAAKYGTNLTGEMLAAHNKLPVDTALTSGQTVMVPRI